MIYHDQFVMGDVVVHKRLAIEICTLGFFGQADVVESLVLELFVRQLLGQIVCIRAFHYNICRTKRELEDKLVGQSARVENAVISQDLVIPQQDSVFVLP